MKLSSEIDFEKKLKDKSPWERFDYLRRTMIKAIKKLNCPYDHLDLNAIRNKLGLTVQRFGELKANKLMTMDIAKELSAIVNEAVEVFTEGHDEIFVKPKPKTRKRKTTSPALAKDTIWDGPDAPTIGNRKKKASKDTELTFVNHCPFHLSLDITGTTIKIYENSFAPRSAKHALVGKDTVMVSGKPTDRVSPTKIKVG